MKPFTSATASFSPSGRIVLFFLAVLGLWIPQPAFAGRAGKMVTPRVAHTATLLEDGRVLSTLLPDGRVLVAAGYAGGGVGFIPQAELYDPTTGAWTDTGSIATPRHGNTQTLLADGTVMITGGVNQSGQYLDSAEIYDPARGRWTATGKLQVARTGATANLLSDGNVLVAGGIDTAFLPFGYVEEYEPATGAWSLNNGQLQNGRDFHTTTTLFDGSLLVAGGYAANGNSLEPHAELLVRPR